MREAEGVEVWNAGTGSVFWLRRQSKPHRPSTLPSNTHSLNRHGSSWWALGETTVTERSESEPQLYHSWIEFPVARWARNAVRTATDLLDFFTLPSANHSALPVSTHAQTVWSCGLRAYYVIPAPPFLEGSCASGLMFSRRTLSAFDNRQGAFPKWWYHQYKVWKEFDGDRESDWAESCHIQCVTAEILLAYVSQAAVKGLEGKPTHLAVRKRQRPNRLKETKHL